MQVLPPLEAFQMQVSPPLEAQYKICFVWIIDCFLKGSMRTDRFKAGAPNLNYWEKEYYYTSPQRPRL